MIGFNLFRMGRGFGRAPGLVGWSVKTAGPRSSPVPTAGICGPPVNTGRSSPITARAARPFQTSPHRGGARHEYAVDRGQALWRAVQAPYLHFVRKWSRASGFDSPGGHRDQK